MRGMTVALLEGVSNSALKDTLGALFSAYRPVELADFTS